MDKEPKIETKETIIKAAIKTPDGKIYSRMTHEDIYNWNPGAQVNGRQEGFLTSTGRFVTREEAGEIAFNAGQTAEKKESLTSPDIFDLR